MSEKSKQPYKLFGNSLRRLREEAKESLDEVSAAVEINPSELVRIEQGETRPTEDVLNLLVNHYSLSDTEAAKLWQQAGYKTDSDDDDMTITTQTVLITPIDARIVYADSANIVANRYGVVMNFMQNGGTNNQPLAIARVGMSREHAENVVRVLQKILNQSTPQPKRLDSGSSTNTSNQ